MSEYEVIIGLEVHAELQTRSKMFCSCPVVDPLEATPNTAVCPICAGMPGTLPVVNRRAVEYGLRVALALECEVNHTSIFARKNYFYPDLPKGYQISQYDQPLARHGRLPIRTSHGEKVVRIRRVHLEEDAGKLTHVENPNSGERYSLVDLNRAGVPLLEIVTEPDIRSAEEARAFGMALRTLLRYLEVNSGDMQKGVIRVEPNISLRLVGSETFGTRTEIKNLNSFRALERSIAYEIQRQSDLLRQGKRVVQQTRGWDEVREVTFAQRSKEEEEDYRYFPEPDIPPLVIEPAWIEKIRQGLPELPQVKFRRFMQQYGLSEDEAEVLVAEKPVALFFEAVVQSHPNLSPRMVANWISGEIFAWMNQSGEDFRTLKITAQDLGDLLNMVAGGEINQNTAKSVLAEMLASGKSPSQIVERRGLHQISDVEQIRQVVQRVLDENPAELEIYLGGKETLSQWFFGQVMRATKGKANPAVVRAELEAALIKCKQKDA